MTSTPEDVKRTKTLLSEIESGKREYRPLAAERDEMAMSNDTGSKKLDDRLLDIFYTHTAGQFVNAVHDIIDEQVLDKEIAFSKELLELLPTTDIPTLHGVYVSKYTASVLRRDG